MPQPATLHTLDATSTSTDPPSYLHPREPHPNVQCSKHSSLSLSLGFNISARGEHKTRRDDWGFVLSLNPQLALLLSFLGSFFRAEIVPYNDDSDFGPRLIY